MHKNGVKELYENSYKNTNHFSFGKNWQRFLSNLSNDKIKEAKKSLISFLGADTNFTEKTFIDIGCGSGLFSLTAHRLGAKRVVSVDIDDFSLLCAHLLRKKENNPINWEVYKGSVLDNKFMHSLGTFDIVYSWGVLHHTGDMYQAISNAAAVMKPSGKLYIAIYNNNQRILEGTSPFWQKIKKTYNNSSWIIKHVLHIVYTAYYILGLILHGINPIRYIKNYTSLRGMSFMTDIRDWLGGYPYEYSSSEAMILYCQSIGLTCEKIQQARSIGCNEFLFKKNI